MLQVPGEGGGGRGSEESYGTSFVNDRSRPLPLSTRIPHNSWADRSIDAANTLPNNPIGHVHSPPVWVLTP